MDGSDRCDRTDRYDRGRPLIVPGTPVSRPRFGLAMIVRDEAAVIERCLRSALEVVDTWTIVDTGSTDDTRERVRAVLGHLPGALHERPWRDFGTNRTELLALARGSADHLLLLDADMTVVTDGFTLDQLTHDAHDIEVRGGITYRMPYVVRGDLPWRYVGRTHEYLTCDEVAQHALLDTLAVHHHADGGTRHEKFTRDLALLEAAAREDRTDTRTLFYLAQTRQALGDVEGALATFRRRIELGGWEEEVFWSLYQIGRILDGRGEWVHAAQAYLSAWEFRPHRAEPLFRLAAGHRAHAHHLTAQIFGERAAAIPLPVGDRLFVERWIYDWGVDAERSITRWWVGDVDGATALTLAVLERDDVDEGYRAALTRNLALYRSVTDPAPG